VKFDHLTLPVANWERSRDWYVGRLGLRLEFEIPERSTAAVQDEDGFTLFLQQSDKALQPAGVALYFSSVDVEATYDKLAAAGLAFIHPPQRTFWGYGAELVDPDGYAIRLWDQRSMEERGS
jgi:catechol 2,3-dioxygenase-like lactoylglutathione lyase family enzyme